MIEHDLTQTAMAREIREIPLTTERVLAEHDLVATVADRIRHAKPRVAVISGRGSSANAGTFLRYLFETRAGLLVSTSAPSVLTTYRRSIDMRNAVFVVISQSGRSPDLVAGARSARDTAGVEAADDRTRPGGRAAGARRTDPRPQRAARGLARLGPDRERAARKRPRALGKQALRRPGALMSGVLRGRESP